jgi:hypothetical protein
MPSAMSQPASVLVKFDMSVSTTPVRSGWSVGLRLKANRTRAQDLGDVQAPDEKAAEAEAVAEFKLNDEQRGRLVSAQCAPRPAAANDGPGFATTHWATARMTEASS